MNLQITPLFSFFLAALALRAGAAVPLRFSADAAAPQTYQAAAYRGETLDIEARLTLRGAPLAVADGASATMHRQTNGMGAAWWTAPASVTTSGLVRATWTPSMDCGADAYRIFLGVADGGSNLSYRANMLLRMVGSPGETPNALPLPVQVLDFSKISVTNEPWSSSSGLTTNDVRAIVADKADVLHRDGPALVSGNYITNNVWANLYGVIWVDSWDSIVNIGPGYETLETVLSDLRTAVSRTPVSSVSSVRYASGVLTLTVPASATLSAILADWPDGAAVFARMSAAGPYSVASSLKLLGYGQWPTNSAAVVFVRDGSRVLANVLEGN